MSQALTFQSTTFDVIDRDGQPWLKASQLARALGYAREDAVSRIYDRNADEFTDSMTQVIEMPDPVNLTVSTRTRIFSLRGCHLLAMLARTQIAKAFRVWVLDVLDTLDRKKQKNLPAPRHQKSALQRELEDLYYAVDKKQDEIMNWAYATDKELGRLTNELYHEVCKALPNSQICRDSGIECLHNARFSGLERLKDCLSETKAAVRYGIFFARSMQPRM